MCGDSPSLKGGIPFTVVLCLALVVSLTARTQAQTASFNLRDYGAIGDGVADDGPALQSALDALADAGGGTLFVPEGHYAIITPVSKDFTGLATTVTISGVESATPVNTRGSGSEISQGLDLTSEFLPKTGASHVALFITGLHSFLIHDVAFVGTSGIPDDALVSLYLDGIEDSTIRHCEFYGISTQSGGAVVMSVRSNLKLEQSKFLGSTANSGVYSPVVENLLWKGVAVTNCAFVDYGQRPELYSKTGLGSPFSWINIGNAATVTNDSPRREVAISDVFLDEGGFLGISSIPGRYQPASAPIDLIYVSGLKMNVSNLGTSGNYFDTLNAALIENSRYEWSHNADGAVYLINARTAILDRLECLDHANTIRVDALTGDLTVIDSIYETLDSHARQTNIISTENPEDDAVLYVRQQYKATIGREPDPAGHYYWSNAILQCGVDAGCVGAKRGLLAKYLANSPSSNFTIEGHITADDGVPLSGVSVALNGSQMVVTSTDATGFYSFSNLPTSGVYTIDVSKTHFSFDVPSVTITTPSGNRVIDFPGRLNRHAIAGQIIDGAGQPVPDVVVTLGDALDLITTTTTNSNGDFSFPNLPAGQNYTVTPVTKSYSYDKPSDTFNDLNADQWTRFLVSIAYRQISGRTTRSDGSGIPGVNVTLSGSQNGAAISDAAGSYSFSNLPADGHYSVAVTKMNYTFAPPSRTLNGLDGDQKADFAGTPVNYQISGHITEKGVPLRGVTVMLNGSQITTGADGAYSFAVPAEQTYTVTPSRANYTFTPTSVAFSNLSANQVGGFSASLNFGVPVLISEANSTRAIALDSILGTQAPFKQMYDISWSEDCRTRIKFYATNFELSSDETAAAVTADLQDATGRFHDLKVEYVGKVAGQEWMTRIIVRLNDDLGDVGDVLLRVTYHGVASNRVRVAIGHIGGGPPDDPYAVPTPGTPP